MKQLGIIEEIMVFRHILTVIGLHIRARQQNGGLQKSYPSFHMYIFGASGWMFVIKNSSILADLILDRQGLISFLVKIN